MDEGDQGSIEQEAGHEEGWLVGGAARSSRSPEHQVGKTSAKYAIQGTPEMRRVPDEEREEEVTENENLEGERQGDERGSTSSDSEEGEGGEATTL